MSDSEKYRKEFDLIYQQLEEKQLLRRQAENETRADYIVRLLSFKAFKDLLMAVPVEDRKGIIREPDRLEWEQSGCHSNGNRDLCG